jgi:hypothetical protein
VLSERCGSAVSSTPTSRIGIQCTGFKWVDLQ